MTWWKINDLLGEIVFAHDVGKVFGHFVHRASRRLSIKLTGSLLGFHGPFGVEGDPYVGFVQILLERFDLGHEVGMPGLHVEDQQSFGLSRGTQVFVDHFVRNAVPVLAVGAGHPLDHDGDEFEDGQHLAIGRNTAWRTPLSPSALSGSLL